jgi:hypothetical protein
VHVKPWERSASPYAYLGKKGGYVQREQQQQQSLLGLRPAYEDGNEVKEMRARDCFFPAAAKFSRGSMQIKNGVGHTFQPVH